MPTNILSAMFTVPLDILRVPLELPPSAMIAHPPGLLRLPPLILTMPVVPCPMRSSLPMSVPPELRFTVPVGLVASVPFKSRPMLTSRPVLRTTASLLTVSVPFAPAPLHPTIKPLVVVNFEPAPSTSTFPVEPASAMVNQPLLCHSPPSVMFIVPLPALLPAPTRWKLSSPLVDASNLDPAPVMFTVPVPAWPMFTSPKPLVNCPPDAIFNVPSPPLRPT